MMRTRLRRLALLLLLLAAAAVTALVLRSRLPTSSPPDRVLTPSTTPTQPDIQALVRDISALEAQERQVAETVWAAEMLARQCGRTLDLLWDTFNQSSDRWAVLSEFAWPPLVLPHWAPPEDLGNGIQRRIPSPSTRADSALAATEVLNRFQREGWEWNRLELRHMAFATNAAGGPARSTYAFQAFLSLPEPSRRVTLRGDLLVEWASEPGIDGSYALRGIDASQVTLVDRSGAVPFREVLVDEVAPPPKSFFIDPVLIHDLDQDGTPEIVLAASNLVYRRQPGGRYLASRFCAGDIGLIFTALLADLNGDGHTDFLCVRREGLLLFSGGASGLTDRPGQLVWSAPTPIRYGQVLTSADVDGDGDLDLWLGQYKNPFERGQMPTPYHDANDGYPAYLLLNDGQGQFTDATGAAGLLPKRHRRTYSASLIDLSEDRAPDLVVISDFAGVDFYLNDGRGRFREAPDWFPERRGFGMAHVFGDFDADGRVDLFVTGMHCPAAHRLESLGLRRPGFESLDAQRAAMTRGGRLYQRTDSGFQTTELNTSVSRSGWSWSPAAADYDNDGYLDLAVANGHETDQSVVDYEPEFWTTDIYVGTSADDLTLAAYFGSKFARTRGQGQSYGGHEANRLYLNREGRFFVEAGWLLGVAVEEDSRNAVPADLNGDGLPDLVVTTFETWPRTRQTIRVFENRLPHAGHWIGVHLRPSVHTSPLGARIQVETSEGRYVRWITSGDLHRAQQPWSVTVGLGSSTAVERLRIAWPDGNHSTIESPVLDRYHTMVAP